MASWWGASVNLREGYSPSGNRPLIGIEARMDGGAHALRPGCPADQIGSAIPRPEGTITDMPRLSFSRAVLVRLLILGMGLFIAAACSFDPGLPVACGKEDRELEVGFYAHFAPVSYSESEDPSSPGFNVHRGYEADLLTGLEAMEDPRLSFSRRGLAGWDDIWLQSASDRYDIVGGGITILESRTRDARGREAVTFTSGHISFRQSLLVRVKDAETIASHADLTGAMHVGALASTTGEHRLLELLGLVDDEGTLVEGVRVETPGGPLEADGSGGYFITAAEASSNLEGRTRLYPPSADRPQVVYLGSELGEAELLEALADGRIDAVARGEIGNLEAVQSSEGAFAVTALDDRVETGGFTLAASDTELLACLDERINWLTDNRNIGYGEWLDNPSVFLDRAGEWNERKGR